MLHLLLLVQSFHHDSSNASNFFPLFFHLLGSFELETSLRRNLHNFLIAHLVLPVTRIQNRLKSTFTRLSFALPSTVYPCHSSLEKVCIVPFLSLVERFPFEHDIWISYILALALSRSLSIPSQAIFLQLVLLYLFRNLFARVVDPNIATGAGLEITAHSLAHCM